MSILFATVSFAQTVPGSFTYQGQITKAGGIPLEANPVVFTVRIYSPVNDCLLYEEQHSVNMLGSEGAFALNIGAGIRSGTDYEDTSSAVQIFQNGITFTGISTCIAGSTYTALTGHTRKVRVSYNDGSGPVTLAQDFHLQAVPYAWYANSLQGLTAANFVQINPGQNITQSNLENLLGGTNYNTLYNLASGTSTSPLSMNNQQIKNLADPTLAQDAATKNYADTKIAGANIDVSSVGAGVGDGRVLSWNATFNRWEAITPSAITDSTKLPLVGGTMAGSINMNGNSVLNTGHVTLQNLSTITLGKFSNAQETTLVGTLGVGNKGATWYNSDTDRIMYWDGNSAEIIGSGGGGSPIVDADVDAGAAIAWSKISKVGAVAADVGAVAPTRAINTNSGSGLTGGGNLSADRSLAINTDNSTLEVSTNTLQVRDGGITNSKIASLSVDKITSAALQYLSYMPAGTECVSGEVLKWDSITDRWLCGTDSAGVSAHSALTGLAADDHTQYVLLAGRTGGQNLRGGVAASQNLILDSTSDSTKGSVVIQPNGGSVGIGTTSPASLLNIAGNTSAPAWTTNGIGLRQNAATYTDTTSSGAVGNVTINTFLTPTIAATAATSYTRASVLRIPAAPVAGANATITNSFGIDTDAPTRLAGKVLVGGGQALSSSSGLLNVGGGGGVLSSPSWTTNGVHFNSAASTITDTTGSGVVANRTTNSFNQPTYASTNPVTVTNGSTVYIEGAPVAGTNTTVTNSLALHVASGNSAFLGNVGVGTTNPQSLLHVNGILRATEVCDENGSNCKDISSGWGAGGDIDGIVTGAGSAISGGTLSGTATLSVLTDTTTIETNGSNQLQIRDSGVTSAKIADGALVNADINAAAAIAWSKIDKTGATAADVGAVATTRSINTNSGSGLTGGGDLTADRNIAMNVDNSTIEIATNTVRVRDGGITNAKINSVSVSKISSAAAEYFSYMPAGTECTNGYTLLWDSVTDRWLCGALPTAVAAVSDTDNDTRVQVEESADEDRIRFDTAGTERMIINELGNVGIGTTSPNHLIHIRRDEATANGLQTENLSAADGAGAFLNIVGEDASASFIARSATYTTGNASVGRPDGVALYTSVATSGGFSLAARHPSGIITLHSGGSAERMRIDQNGNVGIGSTNPSAKLDVVGPTFSLGTTDTTSARIISLDANRNLNLRPGVDTTAGVWVRDENTAAGLRMYNAGSSFIQSLGTDEVTPTPLILNGSGGNVGIGTTSAGVALQVGPGTISSAYRDGANNAFAPQIQNLTSSGISGIGVYVNDGTFNRRAALFVDHTNSLWGLSSTQTSTPVPFIIRDATAERVRIDTAGNLGIGTSSPGSLLHLSATAPVIRLQDTSNLMSSGTMANYISGRDSAGTEAWWIGDGSSSGQNLSFYAGTGYDFRLHTNGNGTPRMLVDTSGNVGIGTATPAVRLDVSGTARATSFSVGPQIVNATCSNSAGSQCIVTATCPGGKSLLSGGYTTSWAAANVLQSYPSATNAWTCAFYSDSALGPHTCYALCANIQ